MLSKSIDTYTNMLYIGNEVALHVSDNNHINVLRVDLCLLSSEKIYL